VRLLISKEQIDARVAELAGEVSLAYAGRPLTVIGVLDGCVMFLADLVRHLDLPLRIGLIPASSYRGLAKSPGELRLDTGLLPDVRGRHVLLLDDILDTGQTLAGIAGHLKTLEIESLRIIVLLRKQGRQTVSLEPDYCGFDIPNVFVVGYGLDFNDEYRHLPHIAAIE
jgi:hypoxanthine phosphoribosyltransferase